MRGKDRRDEPEVYLAAFGKHPGWDDHIEDIGIETERLAAFKQLLYVQGIGGTIDSGAWDNLTPEQRREGFAHVLVCKTGGDVIVGRLWSSTDGKGRARYPMVICIQCVGLGLSWAVREALPRLEALQQRCQAVATAAEVMAATDEARAQLRALAANAETANGDFVVSPKTLSALAEKPELGPDREGLLRILYLIEREMPSYLRGKFAAAARAGELRPVQMRVPACQDSPPEAVLQWYDFLFGQLDGGAEVWAIVPLDRPWVDVFVGGPAPQQFFCFQASREALPLSSEIPYNLDDAFRAKADELIRASREGQAEPIVVEAEPAPPARRIAGAGAELWEKIEALTQSKAFRVGLIAALAAALLLALLIGILTLGSGEPNPRPAGRTPVKTMAPGDAKAWAALCTAFYDWFGSFLTDLELNRARLEAWKREPHLAQNVVPMLEEVLAGRRPVDPRKFAPDLGGDLQFMARDTRVKSPEVLDKTREALRVVQAVGDGLAPDVWPAAKQLTDLAAEYRQRGWLRPAEHMTAVIAPLAPGGDLAYKVGEAVEAWVKVQDIQAAWDRLAKQTRVLEQSGSDVLAEFGRYVRIETASGPGAGSPADLEALAGRLNDIHSLAEPLAAYVAGDWQSKLDMRMVREHPPVAVPSDPNGLKGGHIFLRWHASIQGQQYAALGQEADPRTKGGWKGRHTEALAGAGQNIKALGQKHAYDKAPQLDRERQKLQAEFDALCGKTWDRINKESIEQQVLAFGPKAQGFRDRVGQVLDQFEVDIEQYVQNIPTALSLRSVAINEYWRQRLGELTKIRSLSQLKPKVNQLRADLGLLDSELQITLAGGAGQKDWQRKLAGEALIAKREEVLGQALKALPWADGKVDRDAKFDRQWKGLVEEFGRWREQLSELAESLGRIEAALNTGALLAENPHGSEESIGKLYAGWQARPIWGDSAVRSAVKPVIDRLDRLAAVEKMTDRDRLAQEVARAVQGRFESGRAAWRRLGELPGGWPRDPNEFDVERELHRGLMAVCALASDPDCQARLNQEITRETRRRWEAYFLGRTDVAQIESAIDRMEDFYLDPAEFQGLQPTGRFRVLLYGLRRRVLDSQPMEDKHVEKVIGDFLASAGALPADWLENPRVAALLSELKKTAEARDAGADLTKAGPAAALPGVKSETSPDGSSVKYLWATPGGERHAMSFVRVQPKGQAASYLGTTEVSVGLFIDVIRTAKKWPEIRQYLKEYSSPELDTRLGPRTWELAPDGQGIVDSASWCRLPRGVKRSEFYSGKIELGPPKRSHPVQYVTPAAAGYFAQFAGCRLPTSAEWLDAWRKHEQASTAGANRRDKTWLIQRDHVRELEGLGKFLADSYYPDVGTFRPKGLPEPPAGRDANAYDLDDRVLWFSPVASDEGRTFHHLVGNVAELTFEAPEALAKQARSAGEAAKFLARSIDRVRAIGGSATSAPQLKVDTPYALDDAEAMEGFADVGFRLAFTAPAEARSVRLRRLLKTAGYLTGPAK